MILIERNCLHSGNVNDQFFNFSFQSVGGLILADDAVRVPAGFERFERLMGEAAIQLGISHLRVVYSNRKLS